MRGDAERAVAFPAASFEDLASLPVLREVLPWVEARRPGRALDLQTVATRLGGGDPQLLLAAAALSRDADRRLERILRWALARGPDPGVEGVPVPLAGSAGGGARRAPPSLEEIFAPEGSLARRLGDHRAEQESMAHRVDRALDDGEILILEAGTGIGKSLGYLVPLLARLLRGRERAVVSTHTRNLQAQLIHNDIPLAGRLLGASPGIALLMGRSNYLCARMISGLVARHEAERDLFEGGREGAGWTRRSLLTFLLAVLLDPDGFVDDYRSLPGIPVGRLDALRGGEERCPVLECARRKDCFLQRARSIASGARLVVANHSLLLSDHEAGGGVLGEYDLLVIDEAHHLERVATDHFGRVLEPGSLNRVFSTLGERDRNGTYPRWTAMREVCEELFGVEELEGIQAAWDGVATGLEDARRDLAAFFRAMNERLSREARGRRGRVRYRTAEECFGSIEREVAAARAALRSLREGLASLASILLGLEVDWDRGGRELQDLAVWVDGLERLAETFGFLVDVEDERYVYWIRLGEQGRVRGIGANPILVGRELREFLTTAARSVLLTSATLSVGESFAYLRRNLGLEEEERVSTVKLDSPFDYESQSRFLLAGFTSPPGRPEFPGEVARILTRLSQSQAKRTLCLYTSATMLREVAGLLAGEADRLAGPLLVQDGEEDRVVLARRLVRDRGALLLGLASFWEGVDFPGDALEILVIARLPFPVPTDPLVEARMEILQAGGSNGFSDFMIPEAILRFKQGVGRLIRTRRDRGVVILLDSRLASKGYGLTMLRALPVRPTILHDQDLLLREVEGFFEPGSA